MLLQFNDLPTPTEIELEVKYRDDQLYYISPHGWTHRGIVKIFNDNGLPSTSKDFATLSSLLFKLKRNQPIIASVQVPSIDNLHFTKLFAPKNQSLPNEKHLVLVVGTTQSKILIHDPRNKGKYSAFTPINVQDFNNVYTGRYIYVNQ